MTFIVPTVLPALSQNLGFPLDDLLGKCQVDETGVYVVFENTQALYVGKSMNFVQRLSCASREYGSHHQLGSIFKKHPSSRVLLIIYEWGQIPYPNTGTDDGDENFFLETVKWSLHEFEKIAIQHYKPQYNKYGSGLLMFPTAQLAHAPVSEVVKPAAKTAKKS
jgi:hypothetical protein